MKIKLLNILITALTATNTYSDSVYVMSFDENCMMKIISDNEFDNLFTIVYDDLYIYKKEKDKIHYVFIVLGMPMIYTVKKIDNKTLTLSFA